MALGSSPQPADVVAELNASFPYTFPDARSRWLADRGSSDSITFPTHFANKMAVKQVYESALDFPASTSHSFSGVNFGLNFTGRRIVVLVFQVSADGNGIPSPISQMTIGGLSGSGDDSGAFDEPTIVGAGIFWASPSGSSGTVSFLTGDTSRCKIIVLSVAGIGTSHAFQGGFSETPVSSLSVNVNIPSNGLLFAVAIKANLNSLSWTGVTGRGDKTDGTRIAWGFDNRMNSQFLRFIQASSSGSAIMGVHARSFNPG